MILRADLLIRRGFGCFIRLQPLGDHWLCSPDLHAAALIRPRDGRPRLTGASVPTQGQGPQQMEHIWGMHQPHQRTAFDQTGALLGDHRWGLAPARGGQRFPMLLPGLGRAIVYAFDLQHRQRPRRNRAQYRLAQGADRIAEQQDDLRACAHGFGPCAGVSPKAWRNITKRRERPPSLREDVREGVERTRPLEPQPQDIPVHLFANRLCRQWIADFQGLKRPQLPQQCVDEHARDLIELGDPSALTVDTQT